MRRLIAMFLTLVMCFSFIGEFAFGEDIVTEIPVTSPTPEPASPNVPVPDPPIPPQQNPGSQEQPSIAEEPWNSPDEQPITPDIPITPEPSEDKPEEEHGLPEDQEHGETASEPPTDEEGETPAIEPEKPESRDSFTVLCSVKSFTAGSPATAELTAIVTRSDPTVPFPENVIWESNMLNVSISAVNDIKTDESGLVRTFRTTAEYNGALNTGNVDITATAPGVGSQIVQITVNQGLTAKLVDETGKNLRLILKGRTDNTFRIRETVTFMLMDGEAPVDSEVLQSFSMEAAMQTDGMDIPVYIKEEENGEFTLYANSELSSILEATGNITVTLKNKADGPYIAVVTGDAEEYRTVFAPQIAEEEQDFVFYAAHPEDEDPAKEDFESSYIYSLPLVTIGGKEYNGYKLERIEEKKEFEGKTYSKYWKITIPAERVVGDIIIDANTRKDEEGKRSKYTADLTSIAGKQLVSFSESLTEDKKLKGKTVPGRDKQNQENVLNQEYYFYYMKDPQSGNNLHPIYFVNGVGYPLSPLPIAPAEPVPENSSLYKISNITGDAVVKLGYNVYNNIAPNNNNAHLLVELPQETVNPGEDYSFKVRTHDMNEQQLTVKIAVGTRGMIYPTPDSPVAKNVGTDELGMYVVFTVPASAINGDITIEASSVLPVKSRVKFVDNYNVAAADKNYSTYQYRAFEFKMFPSITADAIYASATHLGEVIPGSALGFEMLEMPLYEGDKADGTASDIELELQYYYDFTGSTMGGKPVSVIPGQKSFEGSRFHQIYTVNGGQPLTGDVLIQARLVLDRTQFPIPLEPYKCIKIVSGNKKLDITNRETCFTNTTVFTGRKSDVPMYRYMLQANVDTAETRKLYLRSYNARTKELNVVSSKLEKQSYARLMGDLITSDVVVKALGYDELDVFVDGTRFDQVSFPNNPRDCSFYNGCVAKMGEDFVFTAPNAVKITRIKVGDMTLTEGQQYDVSADGNNKKYTIPGKYMFADTTITAETTPTVYNVTFSGQYECALPAGKKEPVQTDTVKAGSNYRFTLNYAYATIYVSAKGSAAGRRELVCGKDYDDKNSVITIYAASITGNLYITITQVAPRRLPMYTSKKKSRSGTELDIETWEYLVLDDEMTMYMLVVHGEPAENEYVCYGNNKMLWVESYDGYVWFEASDEKSDDFALHSYDMVDTMTDAELRFNLAAEAEDPNVSIEIPALEEVYNITDEDEISCDVNEDGRVDDEDLRIMRRIFNCDFEDFDDISMRCFVLADADNSGVLDMCDAEIIKCHFDKDEDEGEEK